MSEISIARPEPRECAPHHLKYLGEIPDTELFEALERQSSLLEGVAVALSSHGGLAYAPGKWTVRQLVGHLSDSERVFGFRILCAARCEAAPLVSFDEDAYVAAADFDSHPLSAILKDLAAARASNVRLLRSLPVAAWDRTVSVSGHRVTLRAIAWFLATHALHHVEVLRSRYLPLAGPIPPLEDDEG